MNSKSRIVIRCLFIIFLIITPLLLAPTLQAEKTSVGDGLALEMFLTEDGYLNLPPEGVVGSIDPTGYTLASAPGEVPRFTSIDTMESLSTKCEDIAWDSGFFVNGIDGDVYALAWDGKNLYVGGNFNTVGKITVNDIAKWDGSSWSALGNGVENNNGSDFSIIHSLLWNGSNLYVGGNFDVAGGNPAKNFAKWDGSGWSALGNGLDFWAYDLAWDGNNLYAGGWLPSSSGMSNNIAKWDGSSWSSLGSGIEGGYDRVYALAWDGSNLYAAGEFTTAGGNPASNIAKWDGSSWSALGSGLGGFVSDLLWVGDNLYAVGGFAQTIAQWDGNSWSAFDGAFDGTISWLAWDGNNLYVGGGFDTVDGIPANNVAQWDGSSWSALGSGLSSSAQSLAWFDGNLYAGGWFNTAGGNPAIGIAKWDGSSWSAFVENGNGLNFSVNALVWNGSKLYVGGDFTNAGGIPANRIAQWDGNSWSALGSGINGTISALAWDGSNLYAGGFFTEAGGNPTNSIAKWDGSSWSTLGSGLEIETPDDEMASVYALAWDGSNLYVGGKFDTAGGVPASNIAQWDGSSWSSLGSGIEIETPDVPAAAVNALSWDGSNLYVGGHFDTAGGPPANSIAQWDGSSWSTLGSGVEDNVDLSSLGEVWALLWDGSNLYVGGNFDTAGGTPANNIARWGSSSWSSLGSGLGDINSVYDSVQALTWDGSNLYVGGHFDTAGGTPANNVAQWDGSNWSTLGSGINDYVYALAWNGSDLYAGGRFMVAGGKPSHNVALWKDITVSCNYLPAIARP